MDNTPGDKLGVWRDMRLADALILVLFAGHIVRQIWTNEGSKRVVPRKEVPFGGLNEYFGGKTPKILILGVLN